MDKLQEEQLIKSRIPNPSRGFIEGDGSNEENNAAKGGVNELSFDDDDSSARIGDLRPRTDIEREQSPQRTRQAGLTEASQPGAGPTDDDLSPETLIAEDGANSPLEAGEGALADKTFTLVDADNIGGGSGLDEAELARVDPLDGKKWDGGQRDF